MARVPPPGEAVAISTGAPVPAGARAVLPVEDTSRSGDEVRGLDGCAPEPGRHIRRTGENSPAGALLADSGSVVSPAMLGLAAAAGHDDLVVRPRPRVRLLITGDELVTAGPGGAGRVRDALGPTLPPLVAGLGGDLVETAHVQDSFAALAAAVGSGAASEIVLVTGSTSVGVTDHLHRLLDGLGARAVVDGVTCRPGHPQLLAALGSRRWLIGLPGNPYAAIVAAHTLLAPLLAGLGGRPSRRCAGQRSQVSHRPWTATRCSSPPPGTATTWPSSPGTGPRTCVAWLAPTSSPSSTGRPATRPSRCCRCEQNRTEPQTHGAHGDQTLYRRPRPRLRRRAARGPPRGTRAAPTPIGALMNMAPAAQEAAADRDLVDSLVDELQERINAGRIPAGTWLRQAPLAEELGVSRTPVREALRRLQAMGTVEVVANRGARVRLPSARDIIEVYELHGLLQGHAGAATATLITSEQLDRLAAAERMFREVVEELRTGGGTADAQQRWHRANTQFHTVIIEASGNKRLAEVVESLHRKVPRNLTWIALGNDIRRLEKDAAEHAAILDAIGRGDGTTARRELINHARRAADLLVRTVDEIGPGSAAQRR